MSSGPAHPGVLVGVDGSPSSRVAVRWAAHEATVRNIPLTSSTTLRVPAPGGQEALVPDAERPNSISARRQVGHT